MEHRYAYSVVPASEVLWFFESNLTSYHGPYIGNVLKIDTSDPTFSSASPIMASKLLELS